MSDSRCQISDSGLRDARDFAFWTLSLICEGERKKERKKETKKQEEKEKRETQERKSSRSFPCSPACLSPVLFLLIMYWSCSFSSPRVLPYQPVVVSFLSSYDKIDKASTTVLPTGTEFISGAMPSRGSFRDADINPPNSTFQPLNFISIVLLPPHFHKIQKHWTPHLWYSWYSMQSLG